MRPDRGGTAGPAPAPLGGVPGRPATHANRPGRPALSPRPSPHPAGRSPAPPSPPGPPPAAIVTGSVPPAAPFFLDPVEARYHRFESPLEDQPRGRQRRPAVIGQRASHRGAVAPDHLGLRVVAALDLPLD